MNERIKTLATIAKIKKSAMKAELKAEEDKIIKIQTFDLSLFIGQSYFRNDETLLYLTP